MSGDSTAGDLLLIGAVAVGGYFLWKYLNGSSGGAGDTNTPTGQAAYNNLTNSAVNETSFVGPGSGGLSAGLPSSFNALPPGG